VIAKTFILAKDNSLISTKILRDNKIIRDHCAFPAAFAKRERPMLPEWRALPVCRLSAAAAAAGGWRRALSPGSPECGQNCGVRVGMLGSVEVRDGAGFLVEISGARLRALLTVLALRPGQVAGVGCMIDELWESHPPDGAANALQALVSRLRRALPVGLWRAALPGCESGRLGGRGGRGSRFR
jgi:hypothetical protein